MSPPRQLEYPCPNDAVTVPVVETGGLIAFPHPRPQRDVHIVLRAKLPGARRVQDHDLDPTFVEEVIAVAQDLVRTLALEREGYTLLTIVRARRSAEAACFHLVSESERGSARADG